MIQNVAGAFSVFHTIHGSDYRKNHFKDFKRCLHDLIFSFEQLGACLHDAWSNSISICWVQVPEKHFKGVYAQLYNIYPYFKQVFFELQICWLNLTVTHTLWLKLFRLLSVELPKITLMS